MALRVMPALKNPSSLRLMQPCLLELRRPWRWWYWCRCWLRSDDKKISGVWEYYTLIRFLGSGFLLFLLLANLYTCVPGSIPE